MDADRWPSCSATPVVVSRERVQVVRRDVDGLPSDGQVQHAADLPHVPGAVPAEGEVGRAAHRTVDPGEDRGELRPRIHAAVAASTELQERDALKSVGMAAAMTDALIARGVAHPTAQLAAGLGVLAFKRGYAQWATTDREDGTGLAQHALAALDELRAATAPLG